MKNQAQRNLYIASDHAGFELKTALIEFMSTQTKRKSEKIFSELRLLDLGPTNDNRVDYPDFADALAIALKDDPMARGLLICGSGQGMVMRANRYTHLRAALCWSEEIAKLAREHNDANVLCLASRMTPQETCEKILRVFLETPFAGGRHQGRVEKLGLPPC